jgi:hypothetical protein
LAHAEQCEAGFPLSNHHWEGDREETAGQFSAEIEAENRTGVYHTSLVDKLLSDGKNVGENSIVFQGIMIGRVGNEKRGKGATAPILDSTISNNWFCKFYPVKKTSLTYPKNPFSEHG